MIISSESGDGHNLLMTRTGCRPEGRWGRNKATSSLLHPENGVQGPSTPGNSHQGARRQLTGFPLGPLSPLGPCDPGGPWSRKQWLRRRTRPHSGGFVWKACSGSETGRRENLPSFWIQLGHRLENKPRAHGSRVYRRAVCSSGGARPVKR